MARAASDDALLGRASECGAVWIRAYGLCGGRCCDLRCLWDRRTRLKELAVERTPKAKSAQDNVERVS